MGQDLAGDFILNYLAREGVEQTDAMAIQRFLWPGFKRCTATVTPVIEVSPRQAVRNAYYYDTGVRWAAHLEAADCGFDHGYPRPVERRHRRIRDQR